MTKIRSYLFTTVSSLAVVGSAAAADMAVKAPAIVPVSNWAGFYIGIHGGVARHDFSIVANDEGSSLAGSATGGVFGGQVGYNWQSKYFVYGLEADGSWVSADRTIRGGQFTNFPTVVNSRLRGLETFRARGGLALDDTYLYVTGGLALGQVSNGWGNGYTIPFGVCCEVSGSSTRVGFAVGAGIEHMLTRNVTARAEALYYDLGRETVGPVQLGTSVANTFQSEFTNSAVVGRVGLNLKW